MKVKLTPNTENRKAAILSIKIAYHNKKQVYTTCFFIILIPYLCTVAMF